MTDLIGPGDAGASPTLTTTSDVSAPVSGDTWFEDCVSGEPGTGTPAVAKWLNIQMQQLRAAIRAAGVPLGNSYDEMLSWAMQSGLPNWIGTAGGTTSALTGSVDNDPILVTPGTIIRGQTSGANPGAATFDFQGLGVYPIVHCDGTALTGGELDGAFAVMWTGTAWALISPYAIAPAVGSALSTNIFYMTGIGATIVMLLPPSYFVLSGAVGMTGTWAGSFGGSFTLTSSTTIDARWPSVLPPGLWEVTQIAPAVFGLTPPNVCIVTIVRIA